MVMIERVVTFIASLLFIAPGIQSGFVGLVLMIPVLISQVMRWNKGKKQLEVEGG